MRAQPYLPQEVLFRQKEQFSDGVGYDWIDGLKAHANKVMREFMATIQADIVVFIAQPGYFIA
jgi:hypothetical protein